MKRPGAPRDEPITQEDRDYHAEPFTRPWRQSGDGRGREPSRIPWGEHIFVHECSHAIMGGGIREVDPGMNERIRAAYNEAMAAGKYVHPDGRKHYATTNPNEYWAERAQWWFFWNLRRVLCRKHQGGNARGFAAYDPKLHELLSRVFRRIASRWTSSTGSGSDR